MTLRACQVRYKRFYEDSALPLTDKGRGSGTNGFRARDFHSPEEEFGEFDDDPLQNAVVVEELDAGYEEDYCWDDCGEEPD